MKMVKHMALPFVTICALVSVTVMAYEANYAGNPVTVTNGWDSRQYIATSILRIDSDSVGANVGAGIEVVAKDKNTILKSYIRAEPRLYLDGELWLAEGWHYSDGTQNGLYTESSTYFISRWGEVFAQSEFGTYKGSRGYEDYTAPATAKINLGNIKGNLSATENNKVPHYDTRGNVSTFSALASSFSRSAAVSYADAYVGNYSFSSGDVADYTYYNKQYKNFNASGGDCANYVSQCLKAAGLGTTSNWYYNNNGSICTDSTHDARVGHTCTIELNMTAYGIADIVTFRLILNLVISAQLMTKSLPM